MELQVFRTYDLTPYLAMPGEPRAATVNYVKLIENAITALKDIDKEMAREYNSPIPAPPPSFIPSLI